MAEKINGVLVGQGSDLSPYEAKGFCAILQNGDTKQQKSNRIEDFCPIFSDASVAWVDYIIEDFGEETLKAAMALGFSEQLIKNLNRDMRSGYEDFGNEMGILVPAIRVEGFDVKLDPLIILIRENLIATLHTTETRRFFRVRRYAETMLKKLPQKMLRKDKITLLLIRLIEENNARNFDHLRDIEELGDKMSEDLGNPKTPRELIGKKIYAMKHALITYLGGLWVTVDALNSLRYGDAELLTDDPKILNKINGLVGEVQSQIGLAEHLSEVLASGLEVLQSIYNNQLQVLNNRLALLVAYLTIIGTALLVPNTIATIASGSMFEFTSTHVVPYLLFLAVITVVSTIVAWWAVKKLGLLPARPDETSDDDSK